MCLGDRMHVLGGGFDPTTVSPQRETSPRKTPNKVGSKMTVRSKASRTKPVQLQTARKALLERPDDQDALLCLTRLLSNAGKYDEACELCAAFLLGDSRNETVGLEMANYHFQNKNFTDAYRRFSKFISIETTSAAAHNGAGACSQALEEYDQAIHHYTEAIKLSCENQTYYTNLSLALASANEFEAVIECTKLAFKVSGERPSILADAADLLFRHNAIELSVALYLEYLTLVPSNAQAFNNLGLCHKALGNISDAEKSFTVALSLDPKNSKFLYNFSTVASSAAILARACKPSVNLKASRHHVCYHFAMGKALNDVADYRKAFGHFEKANKAQHAKKPRLNLVVDQAFELDSADCEIEGMPSPIFIVGMPRSGTTLVERILSAHSDVAGAGERTWLARAVEKSGSSGLQNANELASFVVNNYFTRAPKPLLTCKHITDKMPLNFRYVRAALTAFPNAQVVHVYREPRAVAWSNYRTYFTQGGSDMSYATSKKCIADFMQYYRNTLDSWSDLPQARLHHVSYEALVKKPEKTTQDLVFKLGLKPEDNLSERHTMRGNIRTASSVQVRRKIYTNSNLEWQNYYDFAPAWFDQIDDIFA